MLKSSVYQTSLPVFVPVFSDVENEATRPPPLVTVVICACPNSKATSDELPPVPCQKKTSDPCWLAVGVPAQSCTDWPETVIVPVFIEGHVPCAFGRYWLEGSDPPSEPLEPELLPP